MFVSEVRTKGVIPVRATTIGRRRFDESGQFYDTQGRYPDVVREGAAEEEVPLLDLHRKTRELLIQYGAERSRLLFLHIQSGEYPSLPEGKEDDTHLSGTGAFRICDLAVEEMKSSLPEHYKRSEEQTSELQSLMRISYADFGLKKKRKKRA